MSKFNMVILAIKEKYDENTADDLIEWLDDKECWICALEAAGVNCWQGYDYAQEIYEKYKRGEEE